MLRANARLLHDPEPSPELIVVAQSRPDVISHDRFRSLQQDAPLAGIVTLLGSWCEGEMRTGRPWLGGHRLYWYEFPAWWRRQIALRASGRCPDWAQPAGVLPRVAVPGHPRPRFGLLVLNSTRRDNADAIADTLQSAGYSTIWQPPGRPVPLVRGVSAGIWDGAQLSDHEAADLAHFCHQMAHHGAPVIALLDFPRRDRVDLARELGAAAVLGKPWLNAALVSTLEESLRTTKRLAA